MGLSPHTAQALDVLWEKPPRNVVGFTFLDGMSRDVYIRSVYTDLSLEQAQLVADVPRCMQISDFIYARIRGIEDFRPFFRNFCEDFRPFSRRKSF